MEGILDQVHEELSEKVFAGDSAEIDDRSFEKFLSDLKAVSHRRVGSPRTGMRSALGHTPPSSFVPLHQSPTIGCGPQQETMDSPMESDTTFHQSPMVDLNTLVNVAPRESAGTYVSPLPQTTSDNPR